MLGHQAATSMLALVIAQPALTLLKTVASYLLFEAGHSLFLKAVVFAAQN